MTKNEIPVNQNNGSTAVMRHPGFVERTIAPAADIYETTDAFVLMLDMPGATRESIRISLETGSLVIKGAVEPHPAGGGAVLLRELPRAHYQRVFNLGDGVDRNNADAQFEDGVLTVKLYKREELKPREIRIH